MICNNNLFDPLTTLNDKCILCVAVRMSQPFMIIHRPKVPNVDVTKNNIHILYNQTLQIQ